MINETTIDSATRSFVILPLATRVAGVVRGNRPAAGICGIVREPRGHELRAQSHCAKCHRC
jgi:hypothetical protein